MINGFIDKLAIAREAFTVRGRAGSDSAYAWGRGGRKPKYKTDEPYINFSGLNRVLHVKEFLRITLIHLAQGQGYYALKYFNDLPDEIKDVDKEGNMVLWYEVEDLYRELGGNAQ